MTLPPYGPSSSWIPQPYGAPPPSTAAGPASLAVGLVAVILCWIPFIGLASLVLAVIGLVLGVKTFRLQSLGYVADRGLAIAGLVLSALALILSGAMHLVIFIALATA